MHELGTTVVAVATPPGRGGVGCVRISGADALAIAPRVFRPSRAGSVGPLRFGHFLARDGRPLDHGYCVAFPQGASFTGEPTVELWAHGSPAVLAELVAGALAAGASPAEPGEFTYRALRHGRIDLVRAEAVRDLVEARTLYQARVAFAQAEGALSRRLAPLREMLEEWIARGEAAVEFVEDSETHLPAGKLEQAIEVARQVCQELLASFRSGRVVRDGASVALVGQPNVGKSSLFNRLLQRDRAIVTAVPGTTRDTLEEALDLEGVPVRLVDTAGLRDAADEVESEGVRRARQAQKEADLVLLVLDGSRPLDRREREALADTNRPAAQPTTLVVVNKSDLPAADPPSHRAALHVSALTGAGLDVLRGELRARLLGVGPIEDPILTNSRHGQALEETDGSLGRASAAAAAGVPDELILEDLREAMRSLGTITGEYGTEAMYDRIFSTFCIGK
jgi:tRNA modification GTPase